MLWIETTLVTFLVASSTVTPIWQWVNALNCLVSWNSMTLSIWAGGASLAGAKAAVGFGDPLGRKKLRFGGKPDRVRILIDPAHASELDFELHDSVPPLSVAARLEIP